MTTRDNRASAIGVGLAALLVLPQPGTLTQPDRQHAASCYRGITAQASQPATADVTIRVRASARTVTVVARPRTVRVRAGVTTIRVE